MKISKSRKKELIDSLREPGCSIKVASNVQDLTGQGEEWLIDATSRDVIAVFIDGNMRCQVLQFKGNVEVTKQAI